MFSVIKMSKLKESFLQTVQSEKEKYVKLNASENPVATEKPSQYRVNGLNTLVHTIVHTYHPEITEPVDFSAKFEDMNQNT